MAKTDDEIQGPNTETNRVEGGGDQKNAGGGVKTLEGSLEEKIEKKEEQILKMEASVFQLANYYFVFQGVILTAIIKGSSSSLKCQHFWLPLSLSLIGAILNFGTLLTIADKYKESLDVLDDKTLIFYQHLYPKTFETMHKRHKKKKAWRKCILTKGGLTAVVVDDGFRSTEGWLADGVVVAAQIPEMCSGDGGGSTTSSGFEKRKGWLTAVVADDNSGGQIFRNGRRPTTDSPKKERQRQREIEKGFLRNLKFGD
ncbi:hypothetical protein Pfo_025109 [Paulownia fortunei]|nr:hypothetical protein Pfo_025109 [Paulownia fortunei]